MSTQSGSFVGWATTPTVDTPDAVLTYQLRSCARNGCQSVRSAFAQTELPPHEEAEGGIPQGSAGGKETATADANERGINRRGRRRRGRRFADGRWRRGCQARELTDLLLSKTGSRGYRPFNLERAPIMAKIYVGNLPFSATDAELRNLFGQHGTVESVSLPTDRETGRPRGFGFVEMSQADASRAIQALNGHELGGRQLRVNEAQDKPRGGGGHRGGGRW